jgi:RDD family
MAVYDPPQPLWKRNLAGILDFLLAFFVLGFLLSKIFGNQPQPPVANSAGTTTEFFSLAGWPALLLFVLIVAYFVVLGRTGGTVFQRLFGMKRAS